MDHQLLLYQPIDPALRPLLDPEYVAFHERYMQYVVPDEMLAWDGSARTLSSIPYGGSTPVKVGRMVDIKLEHCSVRVFVPMLKPSYKDTKLPALLWLHGGNWATGDLSSENDFCTQICQTSQCVVVTVDYRLAPENPYPALAEDAIEAFQWLFKHAVPQFGIDADRVAVGGHSTGANLAAAAVLEAACLFPSLKPCLQLLILPVIDNTALPGQGWTSNLNAPWMTPSRLLYFRAMYLQGNHRREDWQISPHLAQSKILKRAPRAWIAVAQFDLLAAEGMKYAQVLKAAKVNAEVKMYEGSTHSLFELNGMSQGGADVC
ncbi:uncharacterized protein MYCGRDRAFT_47934 [Zymoseptoria tritici IPO323]|uniref:Alpha/beta hydrolase fold-3 domain-containing protein n=1 Tax=Zymoseptoria tritici (strain CBS 115943 / IPO323) TaxID=336722 RepID=F9XKB7_ZYMTI|nr:uncharacterized protein MYCGRDRAFT_47934 [Zymoseptoria tritici IPO323]EGP84385.1 hypothetical protein MYCGRDRAFT_47934 [Zymoseptoria tritici IPO323]